MRKFVIYSILFYNLFNLNLLEIILKLIYLCIKIRVINNFKEKSYEEVFNDFSSSFRACC